MKTVLATISAIAALVAVIYFTFKDSYEASGLIGATLGWTVIVCLVGVAAINRYGNPSTPVNPLLWFSRFRRKRREP